MASVFESLRMTCTWLPRSELGTVQFCVCQQDLAEVIYGVDGSPGALMSPFAFGEFFEAGSHSEPGWRVFLDLWGPEAAPVSAPHTPAAQLLTTLPLRTGFSFSLSVTRPSDRRWAGGWPQDPPTLPREAVTTSPWKETEAQRAGNAKRTRWKRRWPGARPPGLMTEFSS